MTDIPKERRIKTDEKRAVKLQWVVFAQERRPPKKLISPPELRQ